LCKKCNFIFKVILYWTVWNAQSHWATVSLNYSKSIKINLGPSDGVTVVLSAHRHIVLYWRLSDFKFLWKTGYIWEKDSLFFHSKIWVSPTKDLLDLPILQSLLAQYTLYPDYPSVLNDQKQRKNKQTQKKFHLSVFFCC
jgi:hypothetical protein